MQAVDYIAQTMKARGLTLWSYAGGTLCPIFDACQRAGVRVIVARSELGAGYMAVGASKATHSPQVVAATSGPGATNLVTPIADAFYDGTPLIALTGQVSTSYLEETRATGKRQSGFQETPIVDIAKPITVMAAQARTPDMLAALFSVAFDKATGGDRAGPVLIDIPVDTQRSELSVTPNCRAAVDLRPQLQNGEIAQMIDLLRAAHRPIIIAGAGCLPAYRQLREFAAMTNIRVVASLPAVGVIPTDHYLYRGMIGHTGHAEANRAVQDSDLVIAFGARLDMRQTGTEVKRFAPGAKVIRIDTSQIELNGSRVRVDLAIRADCGAVLDRLIQHYDKLPMFESETAVLDVPSPHDKAAWVIDAISHAAPADCIFTTGVGAHQQHAARWLHLDYPRRMFLTSAGHGCMGAGLPMAIGAALATGRKAVLIDGDGSFQMTLNELGTIARYGLQGQIEIHIIENFSGGIVSQFARLQGWTPDETTWGRGNPDYNRIAQAYGLTINTHVVHQEGVWPILEGSRTLDDMTDRFLNCSADSMTLITGAP